MKGKFCIVLPVAAAWLLASVSGCDRSYYAEKRFKVEMKEHLATVSNCTDAGEKEFGETVASLRKLVAAHPEWKKAGQIQLSIGIMYAKRKDYRNAMDEFSKVYINFPDEHELCARAFFLRGVLCEQRNDWKSALNEYNEVIARYPSTPTGLSAPVHIAGYYRRQGMKEECAKAVDKAVRHYVNMAEGAPFSEIVPMVQPYIIAAYAPDGRWQEAIKSLQEIARKYPDSEGGQTALYRIASLYSDIGKDPDKALSILGELIEAHPDTKIYDSVQFAIGGNYMKKGETEKARQTFEALIARSPGNVPLVTAARFAIGEGYERAGDRERAVQEYRRIETERPQSIAAVRANVAIGRCSLAQNRTAEVDKALAKAIVVGTTIMRKEKKREIVTEAGDMVCSIYCMQKKWQEGIRTLEELRRRYDRDEESAPLLLQIAGIYYQGLNDGKKAKECYSEFVREYPAHRMAAAAQGWMQKIDTEGKRG